MGEEITPNVNETIPCAWDPDGMKGKKKKQSNHRVVHTFNPSTWEAEASESLLVQGHPGLQELVLGQALKLQRNPASKTQTNKQTKQERKKEKKKGKKERKNKKNVVTLFILQSLIFLFY